MVERLGDSVSFYKIGYQLAFASGLAFVDELIRGGKQVFLDMKLHDIENTVAKGVESVARTGVTFLTVHAYPQTMKAAVAARQGSKLKILAVTVLTSYDDIDLAEAGYSTDVDALVAQRAQQAHDLGIDGLVCSPEEASPLRLAVGNQMLFVTPGVRPAGAARGDQKRVATPAQAIKAGADYLVVGRPIRAPLIRRRPPRRSFKRLPRRQTSLMPEMPHAGEHHREAVLVGGLMTSSSRIEPPGWITAVAPASIAASRPSANGKNASEATTEPWSAARRASAPCAASSALRAAMRAESTRLIWPAPMPTVARSLA